MNKALFLDRDGTINTDKNYVGHIGDFEFIDGIFELAKNFYDNGFLIIVVTNQSGIARGYYTEEDFKNLTAWMCGQFESRGIKISGVYFCPHYPEITGDCDCRKPKPGLVFRAARDFGIDLSQSVMVGNKKSDIETGINAGIGKNFYIHDLLRINRQDAAFYTG